ncbi:transcriptional repressor [uncultured Desulfuromonas sp.]|uniref:Fur family transcriptional regulator n=1 Tax=uncultured Desulfuromonas sp. TaxID=181013 RepID=UPI002AAB30E6|nr:transcriptional repressor [uncultured Desulfuromonas sp.]
MEALDQFKQFLQQRGLKFTRERDRIFQAIVDFEKPFDVDGLLFHLKQHEVKTSKATIYRTLQLLLESGLLRTISLSPSDHRSNLYSLCGKFRAYDHLVCTGCGKVTDVEKKQICDSCRLVTEERGYQLESHSLRIFALCPDCQKKGLRVC